ncbi:MAG: hypothetical protein U0798_03825 [Gemmataceae bacterium]
MLPLLLTWIFSTLAAFVLLWAVGLTAQAYLYETVADRIPLRAAIGAVLLGCFYTFWIYANTRAESKDRYGVLQEFSPTARSVIDEFVAVRRYPRMNGPDGKPKEEKVAFKNIASNRTAQFVDAKREKFRTSTSDYLTVAIELKDDKGNEGRFDAKLDAKGNYEIPSGRAPRFVEAGSKRFLDADNPGLVFAPSTSALIIAVGFNVMNYLIWVVAFWPCMRFTLGHSIAGAIGFGALMMLFVVPLLFEKNTKPPVAPAVGIVADSPADREKDVPAKP